MEKPAGQISRIFALLDCFTIDHPELGVREAARRMEISSSACGRLMSVLRDEGVLIQNPENRLYSLGGRVLRWAGVYISSSDLCSKALPYMRQLSDETNETISLYVVEGNERVCAERLESRQNIRIVESIGQRLKLYAGSGGRAILAFMDPDEIERILEIAAQEIQTNDVPAELLKIREHLEKVRGKGYALSHGQWLTGASGIAAPIFGGKGSPIGSVSISGPSDRFRDDETIRRYAELLLSAMNKLSVEMGYSAGISIPV